MYGKLESEYEANKQRLEAKVYDLERDSQKHQDWKDKFQKAEKSNIEALEKLAESKAELTQTKASLMMARAELGQSHTSLEMSRYEINRLRGDPKALVSDEIDRVKAELAEM